MKIKLFVAVFFICSSIFSQIECKHFVGNWKVSKEDKVTNFITLEKDEKGYGTSIIINNKFEIRETFSAPCGNDTLFLKFAQKGIGSFTYDDNYKIFISSIPILGDEIVFKLIAFYDNIIVFKPLKSN